MYVPRYGVALFWMRAMHSSCFSKVALAAATHSELKDVTEPGKRGAAR